MTKAESDFVNSFKEISREQDKQWCHLYTVTYVSEISGIVIKCLVEYRKPLFPKERWFIDSSEFTFDNLLKELKKQCTLTKNLYA